MARTTAAAVKAILKRDYDTLNEPDLDPYIATATEIVTDVVDQATDADITIRASKLERIECWLSAHFYCCSDRPYDSKSTDGSSAKFSGKTGKAFASTLYGQTAMTLDTTGFLSSIGSGEDGSGGGGGIVSGFSLADDEVIDDTTGGSGGSSTSVVITASALNRNAASTTYYITGSGFDSIAANNSVTFSSGAIGTVTAASATLLTVTMTTLPTVGNLMCTVTNSGGTSLVTQIATVVATALVGWWPCNEGSGDILNDISGNANTLTKSAGTLVWNSDSPGAVAGAGGCVSALSNLELLGGMSGLPTGNNSRTVTFWWKLANVNTGITLQYGGSGGVDASEHYRYGDDAAVFGDGLQEASAGNVGGLSAWHHYALTWNGVTIEFFEDGVLSFSQIGAVLTTTIADGVLLRLFGTPGVVKIKDVRIYDSDIPVS